MDEPLTKLLKWAVQGELGTFKVSKVKQLFEKMQLNGSQARKFARNHPGEAAALVTQLHAILAAVARP